MSFAETEERRALREAVARLGASYGNEYYLAKAKSGGKLDELWDEAGKHGFLGVNVPEEYGGGGVGVGDLAAVLEELAAAGCPPLLMVVSPAICATVIEMEIVAPEKQFLCFFDDVRLPAGALVGDEDAGLLQLFAGLNPERIMAAAYAIGVGRYALGKAVDYAGTRRVWDAPIGAHQGVAHPLAQAHIELELARLMWQKAAWLYDSGDDAAAGEAANMAKYAAGEAAVSCLDRAIQTHGGNGLTTEYGIGALAGAVRLMRIAPVSREMILNYVAQNSLGLPKSY